MANSIYMTRAFVVLGLAQAFADAGGNPAPAFNAVGLAHPHDLLMDQMIPATAYYALLDEMTRRLADPYFPAYAGVAISRSGIPVLVEARNRSQTVGECLLRIISVFRAAVTNAHYELWTDGLRTTLTLKRVKLANQATSQVDTLNAAAFLTLLRDELAGEPLTGATLSIPDPAGLPHHILKPSAVTRRRSGGMIISFPTDWLLRAATGRWPGQAVEFTPRRSESSQVQVIEFVRQTLNAQLPLGPVSLADVAGELGISERRLQRVLHAQRTSFREILQQERLEAARRLVSTTRDPLTHIAHACGFGSVQAFSRAFAAAFGLSPSVYRQEHGTAP